MIYPTYVCMSSPWVFLSFLLKHDIENKQSISLQLQTLYKQSWYHNKANFCKSSSEV